MTFLNSLCIYCFYVNIIKKSEGKDENNKDKERRTGRNQTENASV